MLSGALIRRIKAYLDTELVSALFQQQLPKA